MTKRQQVLRFTLGSAVLLFANLFVMYGWVDVIISYSYCDSSLESIVRVSETTQSLLKNEWLGMSQADLIKKLNVDSPAELKPSRTSNVGMVTSVLQYKGLQFHFEDDKLTGIRTIRL